MPKPDFIRDSVCGAIGGLVATAVMSLAASALYRFEREEKKKQEEKEVSDETFSIVGEALHWFYGAGWGATYGVTRTRLPIARAAGGLPFGVAFFLIGDEALNAGLNLTPPPLDFPIDAHIRSLVVA